MNLIKILVNGFLMAIFFCCFTACEDMDLGEPDMVNWGVDAPSVTKTDVHGIITTESGQILSGVEVESFGRTATTDNLGFFRLEDVLVVRGRIFLTAEAMGFFKKSYGTKAQGENTVVKIRLSEKEYHTVQPQAGHEETVEFGNASVTLPPLPYIDQSGNPYYGEVQVAVKHFDPATNNFLELMPGGDFIGVNNDGQEMMLISYGAITVELSTNAGQELQLAPGSLATIELDVPNDLLSSAPPIIPLWHLNEEDGRWEEEGSAELIGSSYIGQVSHFSSWNCDDQINPRSFVNGFVIDCNNEPVSGIAVQVGPLTIITDENGFYETNSASDLTFSVYVSSWVNFGLSSQVVDVPGVADGQILTIPNLIVPCPATISGTILDCDGNPTEASIHVSWNGGVNLIHSDDGSFSILVAGGEAIEITAIGSDLMTGSGSVVSIAGQEVELTDPIVLCDQLSCGYFQIDIDGQIITFPADSVNLSFNSDSLSTWSYLNVSINNSGDYLGFWIDDFDSVGTYPFGGEGIYFSTDTMYYYGTNGTIVVSEFGSGTMQGSFAGDFDGFGSNGITTTSVSASGSGSFCFEYEP